MKRIILYNRDGAALQLISTEDNVWVFEVDKPHKYVLKYCRIGFSDNDAKELEFVDPAGGPFLSIGDKLKDTDKQQYEIIRFSDDNENIKVYTQLI